jgi:hypothetical protein
VDQGVALAHEVHPDAKGGHAWVRHTAARGPAARLLPDLPDGPGPALPAPAFEPPLLGAWTRASAPAAWRTAAPRSVALRPGYPRGPPA